MSVRCECCGSRMSGHEMPSVSSKDVATACASCREQLARLARDAQRGVGSRRHLAKGVRRGGAAPGLLRRWIDRHLPW